MNTILRSAHSSVNFPESGNGVIVLCLSIADYFGKGWECGVVVDLIKIPFVNDMVVNRLEEVQNWLSSGIWGLTLELYELHDAFSKIRILQLKKKLIQLIVIKILLLKRQREKDLVLLLMWK